MGNTIVIRDGLKTYDIVNQDGKILGQFSFNPSDANILDRHAEVIDALEKIEAEISNEKEKSLEESYRDAHKLVCEKLDYLLGANVSEKFFSIMGPFSPLDNGQLFIENVIDAIGMAISAETGSRFKKINTKIQKHTSKYHR